MKKNLYLSVFLCLYGMVSFSQTTELWGGMSRGGSDNNGRIISVNPLTNIVTEVHGFPAINAGASLTMNKMIVHNNLLYGITRLGGKYNNGIIFNYDPVSNVETKLYDFSGATGSMPVKGLTLLNGKMYGITNTGGANDVGVIFEFDPATNIFTKKIDLSNATTGGMPSAGLSAWNGKIYGVTGTGATNGFGAIIEFDPASNTCTPKIALANNSTIGRQCFTGLTLLNDKFYGAMQFAGSEGLIFEWDPATNTYVNKYALAPDGPRNFTGAFVAAGNVLYATPNMGPGQFSNASSIVEFNPATSALTVKVTFSNSSEGYGSFGDLELYNGKYYGTNTTGGTNFIGSFFEWDPASNTITNRVAASAATGEQPGSSFTAINGNLYTTCLYTSNYTGSGTMVRWNTASATVTRQFIFGTSAGRKFDNRPVFYNGKIYAVTTFGGTNDRGVIFSKDVNTGEYTVLHNFANTQFASNIQGQPNLYNGKLYGVTKSTTSSLYGVIWQFDIATGVYTERFNLTASTGHDVKGSMAMVSNVFYGIANSGGNNFGGTIFSWNPATNAFTTISHLSGYNLGGGFTEAGGFLYASTQYNYGNNTNGVIIKFNPANNTFTVPVSFGSSIGDGSFGDFCLLNGKLYNCTQSGGTNGGGTIVEFNPATNQLIKLRDFDAAYPTGAANGGSGGIGNLAAYNNYLYGITVRGGLNGSGTVFRYDPASNQYLKLEDMINVGDGAEYGNGFAVVQRNSVVPVVFASFDARKQDKTKAKISWSTSMELNNRGYYVQRSKDGVNFENIAWIDATNAANGSAYSYIDNSPQKGNNHYRIEQVDIDLHKTYTDSRLLKFDDLLLVSVYPNPVAATLIVDNTGEKAGTLHLFDNKGRLVNLFMIKKGINRLGIEKLAAGSYHYRIAMEDGQVNSGTLEKQ